MKFSAAYLLLVVALNVALVKGEFPIPKREVGFVYGGGKAEAPITVDLYIDLLCSDSRPALATLRSVADHYGPNTLRLTTHLCPLPYKRNAFHAAMGAHVVHAVTNGSATFDWMSTVYDNMYSLSNYATFHMSEQDVFCLELSARY
nr:hypothetical protein BaRGS_002965 [Batillaria attramentaria]